MKYRESQNDKKLRSWFTSDMTRGLLRRIVLNKGAFRGLNALDVSFDYPITAFAGKNGAGKSTILALACCAFHNKFGEFKLPKRKNSYYTFSDFFIQHTSEVSQQGLAIRYDIAFNNWNKTPSFPTGIGIAMQMRRKEKGGKWNDYDRRVHRTVVFLGIERIVPHSERSQSRSYSKIFSATKPKGWEPKVMASVGYVLGRTYEDFRYVEYSKYSLPIVKVADTTYSGFNMGAGENALFEIFSTIYAAGDGSLLVMDEVELGLHAEAQKKFMEKLKEVCLEMHTQVICTTHSKEIFDCLPNDARFYVESVGGKTRVTQGVSSDFAFAKMSAITGNELDIYVEDDVARSILLAALPSHLRTRISIKVIGSATAIARQLAALYVRKDKKPTLAVFDADQRGKEADNLAHAAKMAETPKPDFQQWIKERISYLPGDTWPEAWLIEKGEEAVDALAAAFGTDPSELMDILEYGRQAGKHDEFFEIAKNVGLDQTPCLQLFTTVVCQHCASDFLSLSKTIETTLSKNG
jgi:predicted ATPase